MHPRTVLRRFQGSAAEEVVRRLKELHVINTSTLFGAMFLLSALPFVILMSSFANRRIEDDLSQHLGLNAEAARTVERLFQTSSAHSTSAVVLAVVLTGAGTIGVASSAQEIYEQVFGQVHHGRGNVVRLALWIVGLCGWLLVDSIIATATHHLPGHLLLDGILVLLVTTVFYAWSMHLLLAGRVPWRRLLKPAVVTAVLWIGLQTFAASYFSSTIISDSRLYGSVGVIFSLLTWFIAMAAVVALGAVVGDVWQRRLHETEPEPAPPDQTELLHTTEPV